MTETKTCKICQREKPATAEHFPPAGHRRADGSVALRPRCRDCWRENNRQQHPPSGKRRGRPPGKPSVAPALSARTLMYVECDESRALVWVEGSAAIASRLRNLLVDDGMEIRKTKTTNPAKNAELG